MHITFMGSGNVGGALAKRLAQAGHDVVLGTFDGPSKSVAAAQAHTPQLRAARVADAVETAEVVFLAVPFNAHAGVLAPLAEALRGKTLVDCTNPVGPGLRHGLGSERSGSEVIQAVVPDTPVVKAFTIYGYENLIDPAFPDYDVRPAMLFCGDEPASKQRVATLIDHCGFEPFDVGPLNQALHLEHMTLMWITMVRAAGRSPHVVWAALQRPRP